MNSNKTPHNIGLVLVVILSLGFNLYYFTQHHPVSLAAPAMAATKQMYTCPMDPQVRQDRPGKCPICGMNLVLEKNTTTADSTPPPSAPKGKAPKIEAKPVKASASTDAARYQCPMHPTIVQDHPGDCPICGMKLVKMGANAAGTGGEHKIAFYRSPMDPKVTSPTPRKDEMGMDYVPVYADEAGGAEVDGRVSVTIDPARQQLIGLRTETASRGRVGGEWHTVGRVQADPTRISKVNVKVAGFVERVYADFVGRPVRKGEPLFTLYSPDLFSAQQDYLLARKSSLLSGSDSLIAAAARQRLRLWDMPETELQKLEERGEPIKDVTFASPASGVVTVKNIVDGSTLAMGDTPFEIADLGTVWVMADAYQSDVARVKTGMKATVTLEAQGRSYPGTVSFVDPVLDPQSRTCKVRVAVDNPDGNLKPEMFADVRLESAGQEAVTISVDAVIPTGRGAMVFVAVGNGRFQPRAVSLGQQSGGRVEVREGLMEGEAVVMRANFLVDSESSLRAALSATEGSR
jgi:membrane fusion protein, copper/silver efflux system